MSTLFTRIIEGEIPAIFVWRDELAVAFMSINPLRPGHTLVVPRVEVDHWLDCPPELRDHLMEVARQVGQAVKSAFGSARVGLVIAGLEVPHLHLHVVPIDSADDLNFANAAASATREELEDAAGSIRYVLTRKGASGVAG